MQEAEEKAQFVAELMARIQALSPGQAFDFHEAEFSIQFGDGSQLHLANLFQSWRAADAPGREKLLGNAVAASKRAADVPADFAAAAPHLLPRIRHLASKYALALTSQVRKEKPESFIEMRLGDHLCIRVVFDGDGYMSDVTGAQAAQWGGAKEVATAALGNLARLARPAFENPWPGVYVAAARDNFAASRLLLDEVTKLPVRGRPLAFAVHRDFLAITGDEDEDGLAKVADRMAEEVRKPYPISVVPLVWAGKEWKTHRLPAETDVGRRLETFRVLEAAGLYAEQGELLQKMAVRLGGAFIASFIVIEDEARGTLDSCCTWGEGIASLLPETGRIAFVSDPDQVRRAGLPQPSPSRDKPWMAMAPFARALEVVGHRMKKLTAYPARYRVASFPTKEEFEAMGAVELSANP